MERELSAPVDIADARGRLVREAVGWSRHPLHRCDLPAGLRGVKRWNHWCFTTRTHALTVTVADIGWLGLAIVSFLDFSAGGPVERVHVRPGGLAGAMPRGVRDDLTVNARGLRLSMRADGETMHVDVDARALLGARIVADLEVSRPAAHETLNVLVPWDDTHFQYTSKQQALAVRGTVRVGPREYAFGPADDGFACLDFGRGRWPRRVTWSWAFASGKSSGNAVGFNLGGTWTDGTGVTENGVVVDGRLHKIHEDVEFDCDERAFTRPWAIRSRTGDRVALRFVPRRERTVRIPLGIRSVTLNQLVGSFSGTIGDDAGGVIRLDDIVGLAERFHATW
ncbi:MAG TPA: DUF2804 domain-containing protein [Polyangiaceae bacterium]|jgi:hypothetical protein